MYEKPLWFIQRPPGDFDTCANVVNKAPPSPTDALNGFMGLDLDVLERQTEQTLRLFNWRMNEFIKLVLYAVLEG